MSRKRPVDSFTQTYKDVRKMILKAVWKFLRKCGGDKDELISIANTIFVQAYIEYPEGCRARFSTWLYSRIWWGFLSNMRKEIRDSQRKWTLKPFPISYHTRITALLKDLDDDGKVIIKLILHPPKRLDKDMSNHGTDIRMKKNELEDYLRFERKWTVHRIRKAFHQITEALRD